MFDEQDRELNLVVGLVLAIAIGVTAFVIAIATMGGSPGTPAPTTQIGGTEPLMRLLPARVTFDVGSAELDGEARRVIAQAASALTHARSLRVTVSGYVDATGDPARNAELARQRAVAVRDKLVSLGVSFSRIALRKPETITAGSSGDADARRVEINVM